MRRLTPFHLGRTQHGAEAHKLVTRQEALALADVKPLNTCAWVEILGNDPLESSLLV